MSDLLSAVSEALNTPEGLIKRSAAARAAANGTSEEDVLSAWSGGAPVAAPKPTMPEAKQEPAEAVPQTTPEPAQTQLATIEIPGLPQQPAIVLPQEPDLSPVPLRKRVRTATRIGAWTGAALGLIGFLAASTRWAADASVIGEGPYTPVIVASSNAVIIGVALVSLVFGMVVAGVSRAATAWVNPGMRLSNPPRSTAWIGMLLGLVLGVLAGAILTSAFGAPIEGAEGIVQMPVLATLTVMIIGGAVLGGATAAVTQAVGIPVAIAEDRDEIDEIKGRLTGAVRLPVTAVLILLLLVLPFAWALIQSAELTSGGAVVIAIITAAGILTFASLAGNRPNVKLSLGEVTVAIVGILTVLVVFFSVLRAQGPSAPEVSGPGGTVQILATTDLTFEPPDWSVDQGSVTIDYMDEGDIIHTLTIDGQEDRLDLRVEHAGDTDTATLSLAPGTYTLFCTIPGHREAGMEGTLTVHEATEQSSGGE